MSSERSFFAGSSSCRVRWHECGCPASSCLVAVRTQPKMPMHRFCEKPVFFTFLRIRTHPSSCFDSTIPRQRAEESCYFFSKLPSLQHSLASGERCQVVAKRRPKPRRRAAPIHDKDHAVLRPSFPQPPTLPQNEDAHNTQNPSRPADGRAVAVARQRALRGARRRAQGRRAPVLREQGRGEAREPS